ncbi:MAG: hypothetical protein ACI8RD_009774 [Bacillariaceae sp.]|jgi:hypothetical protein
MMQNQLPQIMPKNFNSRSSAAIATLVAATTIATAWYKNTTRCDDAITDYNQQRQNQQDDEGHNSGVDSFRIESQLMDRIQQKQYLSNAKDGIPSTFRVLAIDLPEFRTNAFTGECKLSHDKVFLDDVAPPKAIDALDNRTNENSATSSNDSASIDDKKETAVPVVGLTKLKIAQKALIRSIVHCSSPQTQQRVGVELLEASISILNRYKLRKKQSFGNYTYDPLKYNNNDHDDDEIDEVHYEGERPTKDKATSDEIEAPWNQYAWMEELRLRINGHVNFDEALEKSSMYERLVFGNNYKSTVPAVYKVWDFFMPFSFAKNDPNGIDGRNQGNVRACNKPHAVIANGAALQLVPSSLRLLQKLCKEADVPLFVVHDPRQWGGNTQASLQEALIAMRSIVKNRVIDNALKQQGSSAFTRGRMLGQIETEAKWQLKDKTKKTKELLGLEGGRRRKLEKEDWSQIDTDTLENKLIERKVIQVEDNDDSEIKNYSPELIEIAKQCIYNQKEVLQNNVNSDSSETTTVSEKEVPTSIIL